MNANLWGLGFDSLRYLFHFTDVFRLAEQMQLCGELQAAELLVGVSTVNLMRVCSTYGLSQAGDRQALIWRIVAKFYPAQPSAAPAPIEQLTIEALIAL